MTSASKLPRKLRAVLTDIDNTLYAYDPAHERAMQAVADKVKRVLGLDEDAFFEAFAKAKEILKKRLAGTASSHSRLLYMQQTLELLGLKTQLYMALDLEQTYWRTFLSAAELFPGVKDFLQTLRRAGIPAAVITDLNTQIQFRKLIYFGLHDTFDFVVTSEEAGAEKPDATPFELAMEKLGVSPQECIMIGDSAGDMAGARNLGIATAQKRHAGVEILAGEYKADFVFDHFTELEPFFAEYGWLEAERKKTSGRRK